MLHCKPVQQQGAARLIRMICCARELGHGSPRSCLCDRTKGVGAVHAAALARRRDWAGVEWAQCI